MPVLLLFAIPFGAFDYVLSIGGKSFAQFGACFLAGYFIMSQDEIIERLKKNSIWLGITWGALIIARCIIHSKGYWDTPANLVADYSLGWIGILAMIGLGKRFLDHNWKFTKAFVNVEFTLFLFHQTLIIMFGYWAVQSIKNVYVQYFVIIVASFLANYLIYLICRRFKVTRVLFAIKK